MEPLPIPHIAGLHQPYPTYGSPTHPNLWLASPPTAREQPIPHTGASADPLPTANTDTQPMARKQPIPHTGASADPLPMANMDTQAMARKQPIPHTGASADLLPTANTDTQPMAREPTHTHGHLPIPYQGQTRIPNLRLANPSTAREQPIPTLGGSTDPLPRVRVKTDGA